MCGRYTLYTDTDYQDIVDIVREVEKSGREGSRLLCGGKPMAAGEIFPTDLAPVLMPSYNRAIPELVTWGFPNYQKKGVIINARAETAPEKPLFRQSFCSRRFAAAGV